ncbi:hypothetical protein COX08_00190 [Candidatus Beckwithbacteria bacterium CG23_combo_of_CG06-09_8_20_14_all_34_8]|uniref:Multidrug ABC transporter substrate-binding protein n=1 Tax=Candidatus Beckwithbacteria bacterium CG23_combo_of_CG06-09_8_20_14_all_34_8 TaxID=1974497 RepID=A0A2H0B7G9_9BACT|nr:MAG: hypothetical protein COX08_00190 [Candidatus Beckwithbacteria bacterium CG23_combo_of_CG06-09_8_20_14_all_34_8]
MIPLSELFEVAFLSLLRNKLRAILTMLGIIIGVSSVILLISIGSGLQGFVTQQFESLGSNLIFVVPGQVGNGSSGGPPVSNAYKLSFRDVQAVRRIGYPLRDVSAQIAVFGKMKYRDKDKRVSINAIDGIAMSMLNYKAAYGRLIDNPDVEKSSRVAAIGPNVAKDIFGTENPVGKSFLLESSMYKVIGVWESKGSGGGVGPSLDDEISIPITTAQKQFNITSPNSINIRVYSKDQIETAKNKIKDVLLKSHKEDEFSVLGQEDLLKTINQILGVISAGLSGIAAISLLVGGIGIMNIMFVTVTERTKEIGLRKALGARPKDILIQFLIEAVTLSLVGGSIGITLAMIVSAILNRFLSSTVTLSAILLAFGFSSVIGIIFGVVPSYRAAKMDPIKALRYE